MSEADQAALRHRYFAHKRGAGVWRGPRYVSLERLDVVMATANTHFSENPERQLGGPRLTTPGAKK